MTYIRRRDTISNGNVGEELGKLIEEPRVSIIGNKDVLVKGAAHEPIILESHQRCQK
jgi:hypothetical protein